MGQTIRANDCFFLAGAAAAIAALGAAGKAWPGEQAAAGIGADARLGAEVDRICFSRDISNFLTIDDEDDAVLLQRGVNDWHKVTLAGACDHNRLRFAQSVAIDQRLRGGCITRGDALVFSDSAFGDFSFPSATRCIITEMFRWNPNAQVESFEK
ncbi:MAG TPA: hypothetical protein DEA40_04800 [Parvularcula sp.]|nr:hypothetical protein [Parvularcula sp.]